MGDQDLVIASICIKGTAEGCDFSTLFICETSSDVNHGGSTRSPSTRGFHVPVGCVLGVCCSRHKGESSREETSSHFDSAYRLVRQCRQENDKRVKKIISAGARHCRPGKIAWPCHGGQGDLSALQEVLG